MLSYQHIYHAGNRADVLKHAVLDALLTERLKDRTSLFYVETHSGRGHYDLAAREAQKLKEFAGGAEAILTSRVPKPLLPYKAVLAQMNAEKVLKTYPGSPEIALQHLRPKDRMALFELHPQEHDALADFVAKDDRVQVRKADGYTGALRLAPRSRETMMVFVDPSYETVRDLEQLVEWTPRALRRWPTAQIVIWLPLFKDEREDEFGGYLAELEGGVIAGARWPERLDERSSLIGSAIIAYRVSDQAVKKATDIAAACQSVWGQAAEA